MDSGLFDRNVTAGGFMKFGSQPAKPAPEQAAQPDLWLPNLESNQEFSG
jgi:hypothetical protein